MPTVRGSSQVQRGGGHNKGDIDKSERSANLRDDLKGSYAGNENTETAAEGKNGPLHNTNQKGREAQNDDSSSNEK